MPVYHCHASYVKKGHGSAAAFGRYLAREGREEGAQFHRYLERENGQGKDDLVAHGHANLPRWAQNDPAVFWAACDRLERKNGIVARHLEIALPRELSPEGRQALADDIREVTVGRSPHSWAIHEPMAKDASGIMPHVHILFSPRLQQDQVERTAEVWFKQVNHGGVQPDASWATKGRLLDVREAVALLTNAALAREDLALAVDHRRLAARGIERDPARYTAGDEADQKRTQAYRDALRERGITDYEALHTYQGWQDQAVKLLSLERQYVKDLARDHIWRYDKSPARQREREQSMRRTLDLAMEARQPHQRLERQPRPARTHEHREARTVAQQLGDLAASLGREEEEVGAGLKVRLFDREREQDRGMSW